jgi:alanine dehydrogenase
MKMKIGIAAENRPEEKRVILRPPELSALSFKHEVIIEENAGKGIGIENSSYEDVGIQVVSRSEVYQADIVVRISEPNQFELELMKPGSTIFSMLHLPSNPELRLLLKKFKINAIPMDEIRDLIGDRKIEALKATGYLGMQKAFELWGGDPSRCAVKIMGYGNVAWGAIQEAARQYSRITILHKKDIYNMEKHIPDTDILVNGINWPMENRGKVLLMTREMLKLFKPGSVILDLISNPAGQSPIETMNPTRIQDISYEIDGVIHTACWGWPGLDPTGISRRYSIQVAPILLEITDNGIYDLPPYLKEVVKFN